jgi:hypothetical protein
MHITFKLVVIGGVEGRSAEEITCLVQKKFHFLAENAQK